MPKIKLLVIFLLFIGSFQTIVSQNNNNNDINLDPQQISSINIDKISDEQLSIYWEKAKNQGYTLDQLITAARMRGMSDIQAMKLRQRILQLSIRKKSGNQQDNYSFQDREEETFGFTGNENKDSLAIQNKKDSIFGMNFFKNPKISFTPNMNMATPENYQVGPGDELLIEVWGATEGSFKQKVDTQGNIFINAIGKINVSGLSFEDVKTKINSHLKRIYSGISAPNGSYNKVYTGVTITQVRTVKVNIIGEVTVPGTYSLSALSTVLNALYACGGPTENGSFREINLVRNGQKIATFDVYEFLIHGSEKGNLPLKDQDVIIVPPYLNRVLIEGEVKRKGAYETKEGETLANLITFFGGFTSDAFTNTLVVERIKNAKREVKEVAFEDISNFLIQNGDKLKVHPITEEYQNRLSIGGAVYQPGTYEFKEGMTAYDLLNRANGVRKEASLDRGLIFRTLNRVDYQTINFSVKDLIEERNNIPLKDNDSIHIFYKDSLQMARFIKVEGAVNKPKELPFMENMTVEDVIALAGGLSQGADASTIDIFREINDGDFRKLSQDFKVSANNELTPVEGDVITLQPNDIVSVRYIKGYTPMQTITVEGEVVYPGIYSIRSKDERISDIIERVGGFSPYAYIKGATLIRKKLDEGDIKQEQFLDEIVMASSIGNDNDKALKKIEKKSTEYRIGIDLKKVLQNKHSKYDLILNEGDVLLIPSEKQTIEIKGEVLAPSLVRYEKGLSLRDYVNRAGGFSDRAKKRSIYVMYANGDIKSTNNSLFFKNYPELEPGAIIIVPSKPERQRISTSETIGIISAITTMGVLIFNVLKK
ncbi:SLBB domain-containing protein [Capnocytophaga cynodegmi]|uniref:Polysaccharide biosynthesis/export protein n=1 Tax=Capnocytophaga cynodegmi TaxID=28189 RepID=A0A0B7HJI6_9FLAO|nr:SLBB domain-containing protein [Capnocytophaga cynodegmi]CEN39896.1 Polysaccharide biosynthesis/export protein [Capnocytophaga cynodegmi]CEN41999.1 Polysaccharide biosynthesis/export protein [Capnocytophaga cynodegmi]